MKPKVLIFIDWFTPAFKAGGPIKSVKNIVSSLHQDFEFYIITSDRDIGDTEAFSSEKFNEWVTKDGYQIAYLSSDKRASFIRNTFENEQFDTYYFNSLYSKTFTLEPLKWLKKQHQNANIILAPRGMLGKGALKIKALKKKVFLAVTKASSFFSGITWHATDHEEKDDIVSKFPKAHVEIVPNIALLNINRQELLKSPEELKLVFFSRISPKKNLRYAIEVMKELYEDNIVLDIYGSIEDQAYWNQCQEIIKQNDLKVNYVSSLAPNKVVSTLANYHYLFFPTHHENYGHVIVEALSAGCGLIISSNTPWRNLKRTNVGWDLDLSKKAEFVSALKQALSMNQEEYNQVRNSAYQYITEETAKQQAVERTKNIFKA